MFTKILNPITNCCFVDAVPFSRSHVELPRGINRQINAASNSPAANLEAEEATNAVPQFGGNWFAALLPLLTPESQVF